MSQSALFTSPAPDPLPASTFAIPQYPASSTQLQQQQPPQPPRQQPVLLPEPSPVPISESDNPDAIALRSTLSILQIQRQRALNDIRALDKLKIAAAQDPEGFARDLKEGKLRAEKGDLLRPARVEDDEDENDDDDAMDLDDGAGAKSKFGTIPAPQTVVRMPPVNWAKYHVVGEVLDRLHEEQRRRPTPGEPRRDSSSMGPPSRTSEHLLAAPYRPFTEKVEPTRTSTRKGSKRKREQT